MRTSFFWAQEEDSYAYIFKLAPICPRYHHNRSWIVHGYSKRIYASDDENLKTLSSGRVRFVLKINIICAVCLHRRKLRGI